MKVLGIQNNYATFKGNIPKTEVINKYIDTAVEMVKSSKDNNNRQKSLEFFNTLYAMKNDGTCNVLSVRPNYPNIVKNVGLENYKMDYFVQYGNLSEEKVLYFDVIDTIIKFGKMLFGKEIETAKTKDVTTALKSQEEADRILAINEAVEKLLRENFLVVQQKASQEYKNAFNALLE